MLGSTISQDDETVPFICCSKITHNVFIQFSTSSIMYPFCKTFPRRCTVVHFYLFARAFSIFFCILFAFLLSLSSFPHFTVIISCSIFFPFSFAFRFFTSFVNCKLSFLINLLIEVFGRFINLFLKIRFTRRNYYYYYY